MEPNLYLGITSDSQSFHTFIASVLYDFVHPTRPSLLADLNLLPEDLSLGRTREIRKQSFQIDFTECILHFDPESVVSLLAVRKHKDYVYGTAILTLRLLMSYIYIYIYIYIYMEHLFLMFLDHTQRRSTVGRTPLDE